MLSSTPEFKSYLENPIVKRQEKQADLDKISKGMNVTTRGFLSLLAENGRLNDLEKVLSTFNKIMDADRGEVTAVVTSADSLSSQETKQVEAQVKSQFAKEGTLRFLYKVEPAILGGLQIQVGDQYIDLSVDSEINKVSKLLGSSKDD